MRREKRMCRTRKKTISGEGRRTDSSEEREKKGRKKDRKKLRKFGPIDNKKNEDGRGQGGGGQMQRQKGLVGKSLESCYPLPRLFSPLDQRDFRQSLSLFVHFASLGGCRPFSFPLNHLVLTGKVTCMRPKK